MYIIGTILGGVDKLKEVEQNISFSWTSGQDITFVKSRKLLFISHAQINRKCPFAFTDETCSTYFCHNSTYNHRKKAVNPKNSLS